MRVFVTYRVPFYHSFYHFLNCGYCRQGFMDEFRVKYADKNGKDQVQALCNVRRPLKIKSVKPVII